MTTYEPILQAPGWRKLTINSAIPMKTIPSICVAAATFFLSACGGGGEDGGNQSAPGQTIEATKGMFVGGLGSSFFVVFDPYFQLVLEDGETWLVKNYTVKGEPIFFATGKFRFTDRVVTTIAGSQTTTTTTTTPERTVSESNTVTTDFTAPQAFRSFTNFRSDDAFITINSNIVGRSAVSYRQGVERFVPNPNSNGAAVTNSVSETVRVTSPNILQGDEGFPVARTSTSTFAYERPADVQRLVGNWSFFLIDLVKVRMTVSSNGEFSGANQATGCAFSGSLTPHPSGKNAFISSVTVTACPDAGSYRGIAATFPQFSPVEGSEPVPAIFLAALNSSNSRVFSFVMYRDTAQ